MPQPLAPAALDQLFREARTRNGWEPEPLPEALLREIYDLAKWGPTAGNSNPARFVFCASEEARARLSACAHDYNQQKILLAPVTVIVGYDLDFPDDQPKLFPHAKGSREVLLADPQLETIALRNGSLQGAYLILAARSLGLDCGPMSGFDNAAVDAAFFAGTKIRSNFICSIGRGTEFKLRPRGPRLEFEEACEIV